MPLPHLTHLHGDATTYSLSGKRKVYAAASHQLQSHVPGQQDLGKALMSMSGRNLSAVISIMLDGTTQAHWQGVRDDTGKVQLTS